jgi:cell division septation protein DedD
MCGTSLEPRRPLGAPRVVSASEAARAPHHETESRTAARTTTTAPDHIPPTSGPSFLGLNEPFDNRSNPNDNARNASPEPSFFGSETLFEQDEPNVGARRFILLLVLLAALGTGAWWAYSHYNKSGIAATTPAQTPISTPSTAPAPAPNTKTTQTAENSTPTPKPSTENPPSAKLQPEATATATPPQAPAVQATPPVAKPAPPPVHPQHVVSAHRSEPRSAPAQTPAAARVAAATNDKGDAEYRRGEAYLYGRAGVAENCEEAIRNLKEASFKQNAKARSAFGTMYATGHCVTRNLPASYSWFASALHADPSNQILEKDLIAIWNQMTPPERQMAMKMKQ